MRLNEPSPVSIAKKFGIKVSRAFPIRSGIFKIVTPVGKAYSLKRMPSHLAHLKWTDQVLLRVKNNGFPHLAWRNPRMPEGKKLYVFSKQGSPYVLTPWIQGRMPSPRSIRDMKACGTALARFHLAGSSAVKSGINAHSKIGSWPRMLLNKHKDLQSKIARANKNYYSSPINRLLQKNGKEILNYSNQARTFLKNSGYYAYRNRPLQTGVLCHRDGGPSNYIMNSTGTYLIDFETLYVDLRAYDLYRIIYNCSKDYKWDFSITEAILDGYQKVTKLSKTDYELIRVWLRFPLSTSLVLSSSDRFPLTESWLNWALSSEKRISQFLQKLERYAEKYGS